MRRLLLLLVLLFALAAAPAFAQPSHLEWGEVRMEDLVDGVPSDTNATAFVLADWAEISMDRDFSWTMEHYVRIKILSEAGYDHADVRLIYNPAVADQRISRVSGHTFVLGEDGQPQRHELDEDDVFEEDLDGDVKRVRFTLPALEPGTVIEYRYRKEVDSPFLLPNWSFQGAEPVRFSGLELELPNNIAFAQLQRGDTWLVETALERVGTDRHRVTYTALNLPALREEPYMTTPFDYRASIGFQPSAYHHPRIGAVEVLTSWEDVAKTLDDGYLGRATDDDRAIRRQAEEVLAGIEDPQEQVVALYDYVRTTMEWNHRRTDWTERDADDILEAGTGTSAELSALLIAMLRAADIEAQPMLVATRDYGRPFEEYPIVDQFNELLVWAQVGDETFVMSPTDRHAPYNLLPTAMLSGRGWIADPDEPRWVDLPQPGMARRLVHVEGALDATGTLHGTLRTESIDYDGVIHRHRVAESETAEDFLARFLDGLAEVAVDSVQVQHLDDPSEVLTVEGRFEAPGYGQAAGDFLYFVPVVADRLEENPLKLPERTFPVDLAYRRDRHLSATIQLPEGYVVEELPTNLQARPAGGGALFTRAMVEQDGVLQMRVRYYLGKTVYPASQYPDLRAFIDRVVSAMAEPVVLRRATPEELAAPATEPAAPATDQGDEPR